MYLPLSNLATVSEGVFRYAIHWQIKSMKADLAQNALY